MIAGVLILAAVSVTAKLPPDLQKLVPPDMEWSDQDSPYEHLQKVMFHYDLCLFGHAKKFALESKESAGDIADAALGTCSEWETEYTVAASEFFSTNAAEADKTTQYYLQNRRERLLAYVIQWRSTKK